MKLKSKNAVLLAFFLAGWSASAQASETNAAEIASWEKAVSSGEKTDIEQFLKQFPDSVFANDATLLLSATQDDTSNDAAQPASDPASATILYEQPLASDVHGTSQRSLRQLAEDTPLFPPVDGLPEAYWQNEVCSNCHSWDKQTLCDQGNYFTQHDQSALQRISHPYGGFFKEALKQWAADGCR